jgi:hypothetical protein
MVAKDNVRTVEEISAAELDLRLLSDKASKSFKNSSFDLFLARYHLVVPWVLFLMLVSYGLQIAVLVYEERSSFAVRFDRHARFFASTFLLNR